MSVPAPRTPKCTTHHVLHVSCPDCMEQLRAEREAAAKRLDKAAR
jgi:hypothetical protein